MYYSLIQSLYKFSHLKCDFKWSGCTSEYLANNCTNSHNESAEVYVHPDYEDGQIIDTVYKYPNVKKSYSELLSTVR